MPPGLPEMALALVNAASPGRRTDQRRDPPGENESNRASVPVADADQPERWRLSAASVVTSVTRVPGASAAHQTRAPSRE